MSPCIVSWQSREEYYFEFILLVFCILCRKPLFLVHLYIVLSYVWSRYSIFCVLLNNLYLTKDFHDTFHKRYRRIREWSISPTRLLPKFFILQLSSFYVDISVNIQTKREDCSLWNGNIEYIFFIVLFRRSLEEKMAPHFVNLGVIYWFSTTKA